MGSCRPVRSSQPASHSVSLRGPNGAVAISWYHRHYCTSGASPGDCHVASLLAMTRWGKLVAPKEQLHKSQRRGRVSRPATRFQITINAVIPTKAKPLCLRPYHVIGRLQRGPGTIVITAPHFRRFTGRLPRRFAPRNDTVGGGWLQQSNSSINAVIPSGAERNRGIYAPIYPKTQTKCEDFSTRYARSK